MKTKIYLCIAVGLVLFLLGGLVMNQVVTAQVKMQPYPMPTTRIVWDYDSGWIPINNGGKMKITHNLGGDPGDYIVYFLGCKNNTYHQSHYGGFWTEFDINSGCRWYELTATNVTIARYMFDDYWDEFRIRILKKQ